MSVNLRRLVRKHVARLCAITAVLLAPVAYAVPPAFTGAPIVANPEGGFFLVNLRQSRPGIPGQGVITGGPRVIVSVAAVRINGAPSTFVAVDPFPAAGPSVCLRIEDEGFDPQRDVSMEVDLVATNLLQQTVAATVQVTLQNGLTVNEQDPVALLACADPNAPPIANAGPDRTIADSDGQSGENVVLDASASADPDLDTVLTYQWFDSSGETSLAPPSTSPTLTVRLPDGVNDVFLQVTDDSGDPSGIVSDALQIIVNALVAPIANAGMDRVIADTDQDPGEVVTLTGTATDLDGTIVSFQWFLGETSLGTGATIQATLPDGVNIVTLIVTDNAGNTASDQVQITIAVVPVRGTLSSIANLDPNQQKVALALDRVCTALDDLEEGQTLTPDQRDLLTRCDGIYFNNSVGNQVQALDQLVADDFAVARTQTLLFANTQYASVMDRLMALRGGARGLSLAGLNIIVDGKPVPLAQLQDMAKDLFGGGASADEPGGLLSDKWGMWARGNYSFGEKDDSASSPRFDAKQWAMVGGVDYRLSDKAVIGLALSYGQSSVEFSPSDEGALDTTSWAGSFYGSVYAAKNFYFDAIVNVANSSYDAERNITYVDGIGLVNVDASGDTDGLTLSGGLSAGYDFLVGGLTLSPNLGFFYIDTTIDGFTEKNAGGLSLIYDEQKFESLTGNAGLRATYAWNLSWGVLLPHLRIDFVREFEDDVDVFGVRFAADPNAASAPPILVATDNPDTSYWRLAAGFSAQFKHGFSGYVEYQRLESFEFISFQDVSIGLRMQRSF